MFLATVAGQLVPGGRYGGDQFGSPWVGWPQPWAFRCDGCGAVLPYACTITRANRRKTINQARVEGFDRHLCGACDGFTEQIGLWS